MDDISQPQMEVKGVSSLDERASWTLRLAAISLDLFILIAVFFLGLRLFGESPIPRLFPFIGFLVVGSLALYALKIGVGISPGQWVWGLRTKDKSRHPLKFPEGLDPRKHLVLQRELLFGTRGFIAAIISVFIFALTFWQVNATLTETPILAKAEPWALQPFAPIISDPELSNWMTLPYYYASGAWPKRFQGRPILAGLPYAKGPPRHFPSQVRFRWRMPEIHVTIYGPKTRVKTSPRELKECLEKSWSFSCLASREKSLLTHLRAMAKLRPHEWDLKWFEVQNSQIPREEWAQGIFIRASTKERTEERYILINHKGAQQTLVLERSNDAAGTYARELFEQMVRSLRVFDHLYPGRDLVNKIISQTQLNALRGLDDSVKLVGKLGEIQAMLLSKISVEPKNHQAYYHLGGTAMMLAKHAADLKVRNTQVLDPRTAMMVDDWSSAAKPLIHSAFLYAKDVSPDHPNTTRLQNLWIEAQKL